MRIQLANKGGKQADSFRLIFTQQGGTYQPTKMDWTCNFGAVWTTQQKLDMALQKAWFLQYPPVIKHGVLENLYLQMILPAFFTSISREFRKEKNKKKLYFQGISRVCPWVSSYKPWVLRRKSRCLQEVLRRPRIVEGVLRTHHAQWICRPTWAMWAVNIGGKMLVNVDTWSIYDVYGCITWALYGFVPFDSLLLREWKRCRSTWQSFR